MAATIVEPKRGVDMGRVVVPVVVENVDDVRRAERGEIPHEQVRRVKVDALVDSGATFMCLPLATVEQLGLPFNRIKESRSVIGPLSVPIHGSARITVEGRACDVEVMALSAAKQALLGQIPLETLDFWVDLTNRRLVGNPEHGGEWMAEMYDGLS